MSAAAAVPEPPERMIRGQLNQTDEAAEPSEAKPFAATYEMEVLSNTSIRSSPERLQHGPTNTQGRSDMLEQRFSGLDNVMLHLCNA